MRKLLLTPILTLSLAAGMSAAEDQEDHGETDITKLSDEQISKRLENPLTNLLSLLNIRSS